MRAADVVETLPTVGLDDDVISAVRMVTRQGLPGLVVTDERGEVVGCQSSIGLLRLVLPAYLWNEPDLARVFDEDHADRIAAALVGARVRDVIGEAPEAVPVARPRATVVELAELMVRHHSPLVVVQRKVGGNLGVVTANGLLSALIATAEERPR